MKNSKYELHTLNDLGELKRGVSKHRPRNDKKLFDGEYPFIQTGEVRSARWKVKSYSQTYNEIGLKQSKLWKEGTLCITIAANIAETAILDIDACFPDSVLGFTANKEICNIYYIDYMLRNFKNKLVLSASQTAQKNINLGTFEHAKFLIPDKKTQDSIVNDIIPFDLKIEKNEEEIAILEEYIQLLFHQWFVDFNFPNDEGKSYRSNDGKFHEVDGKLIPIDWETITLNKVVKKVTETIKPQDCPECIFKHYSIPIFDETKTYAKELGSTIKSNKYRVKEDYLLVSKLNPWFKRIIYPMSVDEAICSTEFVVWKPLKENHLEYLYVLANTDKFTRYCTIASTGTSNSHKRVEPDFMLKFKVPYNEKVVIQFNELVIPLIKKIHLAIAENQVLVEARDLLIKKLIII